jgi:hypothetical protein
MKFTIRNGPTTLEFEGELEEFNRLAEEVDIPPDLLARMRRGSAPDQPPDEHGDDHEHDREDDGDRATGAPGVIDVRALAERLGKLEVKSDIDRVTVMAHEACKAGLGGIDYETAERLFVELASGRHSRTRRRAGSYALLDAGHGRRPSPVRTTRDSDTRSRASAPQVAALRRALPYPMAQGVIHRSDDVAQVGRRCTCPGFREKGAGVGLN